jgi:acyl transferase domain-containing protein
MNKQDIRCAAPESRYSVNGFCNPRSKKEAISTPLGYFLDESVRLDALDTSFFNLNQLQAQMMDPQQRLLLEVAWECMENSGQANLRGSNTGVFAGSYSEDWSRLVYQDTQGSNAYRVLGTADFVLSSVLSYYFDLRGPR